MHPTDQLVPSTFLQPGDQIVVAKFSVIPCDCYVTTGSSLVNQAIVTGEPMPLKKAGRDILLGGTRNLGGELVCVVDKEQGCSFYAELVNSVVEASGCKAQEYQYPDAITKYFVLGVLLQSILAPTAQLLRFIGYCEQERHRHHRWFPDDSKLQNTKTILFDETGTLTRATLEDAIREDAKSTIDQLTSMRYDYKLLTGDVAQSAHRVCDVIGIRLLAREATPQNKLNYVKSLQEDEKSVAMIGDGLNDAPSLAAADVGIALCKEAASPTAGASAMILNSRWDSILLLLEVSRQA
ncbi:HAD-like domain-containing protein [Dactylonectria estremocensis]|uniref:HAD-like domain-containing protein n=1 Tax=Dactylonectria estremocensis TaxID=1079267 RepID=A0A9P9EGH5_9HYPO|nr:HAD-like domain-containing protein [Dactylonectria estremocensis]